MGILIVKLRFVNASSHTWHARTFAQSVLPAKSSIRLNVFAACSPRDERPQL